MLTTAVDAEGVPGTYFSPPGTHHYLDGATRTLFSHTPRFSLNVPPGHLIGSITPSTRLPHCGLPSVPLHFPPLSLGLALDYPNISPTISKLREDQLRPNAKNAATAPYPFPGIRSLPPLLRPCNACSPPLYFLGVSVSCFY